MSSFLGNDFNSGGKDNITVLNCLLHNSGLSPDPEPWYWDPEFGCPNTNDDHPAQDFSCISTLIYRSILEESIDSPPGAQYVYSDIGFEILSYVVGIVALERGLVSRDDFNDVCVTSPFANEDAVVRLCAFEAFVRKEVFRKATDDGSVLMPSTQYLLAESLWSQCAPTLNDTGDGSYTHKRLQGQVADGDCYAMGGIAGHAGVFSTASDIGRFLSYMLAVIRSEDENFGDDKILNKTTLQYFTTIHNGTQSSRALGWSTNSDEVKINIMFGLKTFLINFLFSRRIMVSITAVGR